MAGNNEGSIETNYKVIPIIVFLVGVLFISLYYLNPIGEDGSKFWKTILVIVKDVGIAFIVSVVVLYVIEISTHKKRELAAEKLARKMNEDVFKAVYHKYIPPIIFNEVERCLMGSGVIRSEYRVTYALRKSKDELLKNHYLCTLRSRYMLKNIAGGPVDEIVRARLELPITKELHTFVKFTKVIIGERELSEEEITNALVSDGKNKTFSLEVLVPLGGLNVDVHSQLVKRLTDQEVWTTSYAADGIELTIHSPSDCRVEGFANHSKSKHVIEDREVLDEGVRKYELKLNYGIIPHQSFVIWWSNE